MSRLGIRVRVARSILSTGMAVFRMIPPETAKRVIGVV
jgi:hypothetical protein